MLHFRKIKVSGCTFGIVVKTLIALQLLATTLVAEKLSVEYIQNNIYYQNPLRCTFSEPMIPFGYPADSVPKCLSISPYIPGKWSWYSQNTLHFSPDVPWHKGNYYTITIPSGVVSKISGNHLKNNFQKVVICGTFSGSISDVSAMRSTVSFVNIEFTLPVHPDTLRRHLMCNNTSFQLLTSDSITYRIRPKAGWIEGEKITLSIDNNLTPYGGNMHLESPLSISFTVSDSIKVLGLFRNDKRVSSDDTLFLEDEYTLRFSHPLHNDALIEYALLNGNSFERIPFENALLNVNQLITPGKPSVLLLKAGLPSNDSAFLFNDSSIMLIGDSNRINPALPTLKIKDVLVIYEERDSTRFSGKTPVDLRQFMNFKLLFENADTSCRRNQFGNAYCFTPDGTDTLEISGEYLSPHKLPPATTCTLFVKAGYRAGNYQLKKDFKTTFQTGPKSHFEYCKPLIHTPVNYLSGHGCETLDYLIMPVSPAIPLKLYGLSLIAAAMRSIPYNELLIYCDSAFVPAHNWHIDTIKTVTSDRDWYQYIPVPLAPVLSEKGRGTAEVAFSLDGNKFDAPYRYTVTDLGIQLINFRLSTVVIVSSLTKRLPVALAQVTLLDKDNCVLAKGRTDALGFFQIPQPVPVRKVMVATSDDTLVYRCETSSFPDTTICDGTIITDREFYRPGDTLFFKGIVRTLKDRWEPHTDDSAVISIQWENAAVLLDTLPLSGLGSFSGNLIVPSEVVQKQYLFSATLLHANGTVSRNFNVTEFRIRELTATAHNGIIEKDSVKFTISTTWLHGGAAGRSPFTWECHAVVSKHFYPSFADQDENNLWCFQRLTTTIKEFNTTTKGTANLDINGSAVVTIPRFHNDQGMKYYFSARVEGSPVQSALSTTTFVEIPSNDQLYIGTQEITNRFIGDTIPIMFKFVDNDGHVVNRMAVQTVIVQNKPVKSLAKNRHGLPAVIKDTLRLKVKNDIPVTDSAGIIRVPIQQLQEGDYTITVHSSKFPSPEPFKYNFTILIPDTQTYNSEYDYNNDYDYYGSFPLESSGYTIISLDSVRQSVGDSVRFKLKAPVDSCNVLVSICRENMYEHRWYSLTGKDTVISFLLHDNYIPAVNVQASFFPPLQRTSKGELAFEHKDPVKIVSVKVQVSSESRHIPVSVTTDKTNYAPDDSVTIHISIPKKSFTAKALVMVVDEGVLQLGNSSRPDINAAFRRSDDDLYNCNSDRSTRFIYGPFDYDSCNMLRIHPTLQDNAFDELIGNLMGGDSRGLSFSQKGSRLLNLRSMPRPCAYFNPDVQFDANGKASCRIKLPGNLTEWRVTAVVDDTSTFGVSTVNFTVSKPLMIRPQLPRFLRVGDSASATYIVENRSQHELTITSGSILRADSTTDTNTLHVDNTKRCNFPLIGRTAGKDSLLLFAYSDSLSDGIKSEITTIYERPRNVAGLGGSTLDSVRIPVILPARSSIDSGNIVVSLSKTRMQNLHDGVEYLFDYPYGCLEQQSSKIVPLLVLDEFTRQFHLAMLPKGDEKATIQKYLDNIGTFQNKSDGGLGYWPSDFIVSDTWLTAFVLEIMIKSKSKGYIVSDSVYTKALNYLRQTIGTIDSTAKRQFVDSYLNLIVAQAGKPDHAALKKLYKARNMIPLSAQINLLKAMYTAGYSKRKVTTLQKILQHGLIEKDRLAYFSSEHSAEFEYWHESPVRQTALALEALLQTGNKSRFDEPMIRWLASQRRNGRWNNTQENMAVFRAFAAYTAIYEHDFPKLNAVVELADSSWFSTSLEGREETVKQASRQIDSTYVNLNSTVSILKNGTGRLYWDLLMNTYPSGIAPPVSSGFSIARTVTPIDTFGASTFNPSSVKVGVMLKVTVTVQCFQNSTFVAINDPIPAGCEALNPVLKIAEKEIARKNTHWSGPSYLSHQEFRDSRVLCFIDNMQAGVYQFSYVLKPATAGKFHWPAPLAESMYYPEFFGRGAETTVFIND